MNKAVFLDRDGVINNGDLYYTYRQEDFFFNPDVFESLKHLQQAGYLLIIITNQGGISKGEYTIEQVEELHRHMLGELNKQGIQIAEVYFCPHHDALEKCICRKPDSGMIEKALARFNINPKASYLIGDSERDILSGEKQGLTSIKIDKNASILEICRKIVASKI